MHLCVKEVTVVNFNIKLYHLYPVLSTVISYHPGHSLHLIPLLLDIPHCLDEVILRLDLSLLFTTEWKPEDVEGSEK